MKSYCRLCKKQTFKKNILCKTCIKNPFRVEDLRMLLSKQKEYTLLKKTYTKKFSEIKNLNTALFWNQKLYNVQLLQNQDGMTKARIQKAIEYLPTQAQKILDIGVGYGFIEEKLSLKRIKLYGIDIAPTAINNVKKRFKGYFSIGSIYKLKFKPYSFDCIFLLEVLEHIPPYRTLSILKKIYTLLKKNGVLVLSVPLNEGLEKMKINPNGHVRTYTQQILEAELQLCGFRIIRKDTFVAFKTHYTLKNFLRNILTYRWKPNNIIVQANKNENPFSY